MGGCGKRIDITDTFMDSGIAKVFITAQYITFYFNGVLKPSNPSDVWTVIRAFKNEKIFKTIQRLGIYIRTIYRIGSSTGTLDITSSWGNNQVAFYFNGNQANTNASFVLTLPLL